MKSPESAERVSKTEFSKLIKDFIQGCREIGGVVDDRKHTVSCYIGFRPKYEEENRIGLRGVEEVRPSEVMVFDTTGITIDKKTGFASVMDEDVSGHIVNPNNVTVFGYEEQSEVGGKKQYKEELVVEHVDENAPWNTQAVSMRIHK